MKITSYNQHCSAPFSEPWSFNSCQVYSERGADNVIQSAVWTAKLFWPENRPAPVMKNNNAVPLSKWMCFVRMSSEAEYPDERAPKKTPPNIRGRLAVKPLRSF
jgi:hypothetical protein